MAFPRSTALLVVAGALATAGCAAGSVPVPTPAQFATTSATPTSLVVRTYQGLPPDVAPGAFDHLPHNAMGWPKPGTDLLVVITWGSGTCPLVPVGLDVRNRHAVLVHITQRTAPGGACTMDLGPTTSEVRVDPARVDLAPNQLEVSFTDGKQTWSSIP